MKKNWLTIIGIVFVVVGAGVSYFGKFAYSDIAGFASVMFGAGLACANLWNKRDESVKAWVSILSIAFIGVGCFIVGFGGFIEESTVMTIISSVIGFVAIIVGLLLPIINKYKE